MRNLIVAVHDPSLAATVVSTMPLLYNVGADVSADRPAHVRAASALAAWRDVIALVQDDSNFVALVDPRMNTVEPVALPAGEGGLRQFDDLRGNKRHKLDLEACVALTDARGALLLILGSGSTTAREVAILLRPDDAAEPRIIRLPALYAHLRAARGFAGSELNVEGAARIGAHIRVFNRGNGAARGDHGPVNASVDVYWPALRDHIERPEASPPPALENMLAYDLGAIDGVPLTFTDAVGRDGRILYVAAAEASPDVTRDGRVAGSAIGFTDGVTARWTELRDASGGVFAGKVEGVCLDTADPQRVFVVVDRDDASVPSELCVVRITGL